MLRILKVACLAIYGFALASLLMPELASGLFHAARIAAIVFLISHAFEVVFAFERVRLYRGPLAFSVFLTMLFGMLHWLPLKKTRACSAP
ncbi:hypothetical protein [Paraburkholderia dipogonis]|jgi:uncharacterized protein YhhL (DUF1145 family)|uniref:hypothetical protein n=1 Tax=Paraburkholderia dipogonis TaxID=1211383 RepID=UPI0038BA4E55